MGAITITFGGTNLQPDWGVLIFDDCAEIAATLSSSFPEGVPCQPTPSCYIDEGYADVDGFFDEQVRPLLNVSSTDDLVILVHLNLKVGPHSRRRDQLGVDLLKHIRLTASLGRRRCCHVALYTFESSASILRRRPGNLIVHSPGASLWRLPEDILVLQDPVKLRELAGQLADVRLERLDRYIRCDMEKPDARTYAHSYLNRAGAAKFIQEFGGHVVSPDHSLLAGYRQMAESDLEWKKLAFRQPLLLAGGPPSEADAHDFIGAVRDSAFLYIDDEHHWGWSLGLYSGVFGNCSMTPNPRLVVLASLEEGLEFVQNASQRLRDALQTWAAAADECEKHRAHKSEAEVRYRAATEAKRKKLETLQAAEQELEAARNREAARLQETKALVESFASVALDFVDRTTAAAAEDQSALRQLEQGQKVIVAVGDALKFLYASREQTAKTVAAQLQAADGLAQAERQVGPAAEAAKQAEQLRRGAEDTLNRAERALLSAFPDVIVLLDLRLEPQRDETRKTAELSGIRILKALKDAFPILPIIIMTASERAASVEIVRSLGADAYWTKGISSGAEMRSLLIQAVRLASLNRLWLRLQQVRIKSRMICQKFEAGGFQAQVMVQGDQRRAEVENQLEDSLFLLREYAKSDHQKDKDLHNVLRNLGLVQEFRFQNIKDVLWREKVGPEEFELHQLRNQVSHADRLRTGQNLPITFEVVRKHFVRVVDRLWKS